MQSRRIYSAAVILVSEQFTNCTGFYDVDFIYDSYDDIWGTGFDFNKTNAINAVTAINYEINKLFPMPWNVVSLTPYRRMSFYEIPYELGSAIDSIDTYYGIWNSTGWSIGASMQDTYSDRMYAKLHPASVPDASIILLLGSSLIGLAVFSRKSKRS